MADSAALTDREKPGTLPVGAAAALISLEFCAFAFVALPRYLVARRVAADPRVGPNTRNRIYLAVAANWVVVALLLVQGRALGVRLIVTVIHRAVTATRAQYVWHAFIGQDRHTSTSSRRTGGRRCGRSACPDDGWADPGQPG